MKKIFFLITFLSFFFLAKAQKHDIGIGFGLFYEPIGINYTYKLSPSNKIGLSFSYFGWGHCSTITNSLYSGRKSKKFNVYTNSFYQQFSFRNSYNKYYDWKWFFVGMGYKKDFLFSKRLFLSMKLGVQLFTVWIETFKVTSEQLKSSSVLFSSGEDGSHFYHYNTPYPEPLFDRVPFYFGLTFGVKL